MSSPDVVAIPRPVGRGGGWLVELPGVEPGSRDPEALGSTCVGSGSSRARCSGTRQPPCPIPPFGVPLGPVVMSAGWSLVMSIRPSYEASEADRRRCLGCECHVVIGSCVFPRVLSRSREHPRHAPMATARSRSKPCQPQEWCASSLWSCQTLVRVRPRAGSGCRDLPGAAFQRIPWWQERLAGS